MEPILFGVFHSCFPCTLLRDCSAKTAFWVRKEGTVSAVTLHPQVARCQRSLGARVA